MTSDLKISDILIMQEELQEKYKDHWRELTPENGRNSLLWMMEEVGEVISIIKKRGDRAIMNDEDVREKLVEEMVDILMYYSKILICYDISAKEFSDTFLKKHMKNMNRDFVGEYKAYLKK